MALADLIMHEPPVSYGATAVYPFKPNLERKFRFLPRFSEEPISLCRHDKQTGMLHLPRAVCPVGPNDQRSPGDKAVFMKCPTPRPHQEKVFAETDAFISVGMSGVVSAYTGWGKTVLGFRAAYLLQRKTLVVTTKDDIAHQWRDGATEFLGVPPHKVGEIRGDNCQVVGTDFVVAMIQSLSKKDKYPPEVLELFSSFGLVILDECHRVPADQFHEVCFMFPAMVRLGLSATPKRFDGKEIIVQAHIGPIRAQTEEELMVPKVLRFTSEWKCPRVFKTDKETKEKTIIRLPHTAGKTAHIERMMAADPERNAMLADMVQQALAKGRKVVVFSTLIEHLKMIMRVCTHDLKISGKSLGLYVGATTKAEHEHRDREAKKDVLFTTYIMMSEGTDVPWLDTVILAMPRSNVTQPVGRIRRLYEGKKDPVVMDLVDTDSPVFLGYANGRLKWYKSIGATIKEMN
jgi:superfamily II DNA or RNA helicase